MFRDYKIYCIRNSLHLRADELICSILLLYKVYFICDCIQKLVDAFV